MAAFLRLRFAAPVLGLALLTAAAAGAAPFGYTVSDGELRRVDLFSGTYETIGPTGIGGVFSLAEVDARFFYGPGVTLVDSNPVISLNRFDRATGHGEQVGPTGALNGILQLAGSGNGSLYGGDDTGNLYQIDIATAALTPIAATGANITALAARDGALYLLDYQGELGCQLRRFELADHTLSTVINHAACFAQAAFGDDGYLYQSAFLPDQSPLPSPPYWSNEVYRSDLAAGQTEYLSGWFDSPGLGPVPVLAAVSSGITVDVPIDSTGLLLLAAGLALAALRLLRA